MSTLPIDATMQMAAATPSDPVANAAGVEHGPSAVEIPSAEYDLQAYVDQLRASEPQIAALPPDVQGRHFADPGTLGDQILNKLQNFHDRSQGTQATSPSGSERLPGPAEQHPGAPSIEPADRLIQQLQSTLNWSIEASVITQASKGMSNAASQLLRGQ